MQLIAGKIVYGLYDTDGILRCIDADRDACIAYAELFNFPSTEDSLVLVPETKVEEFKDLERKARRRAKSSN